VSRLERVKPGHNLPDSKSTVEWFVFSNPEEDLAEAEGVVSAASKPLRQPGAKKKSKQMTVFKQETR